MFDRNQTSFVKDPVAGIFAKNEAKSLQNKQGIEQDDEDASSPKLSIGIHEQIHRAERENQSNKKVYSLVQVFQIILLAISAIEFMVSFAEQVSSYPLFH